MQHLLHLVHDGRLDLDALRVGAAEVELACFCGCAYWRDCCPFGRVLLVVSCRRRFDGGRFEGRVAVECRMAGGRLQVLFCSEGVGIHGAVMMVEIDGSRSVSTRWILNWNWK